MIGYKNTTKEKKYLLTKTDNERKDRIGRRKGKKTERRASREREQRSDRRRLIMKKEEDEAAKPVADD